MNEELTVEEALRELKKMFPKTPVRLSIRQDFVLNGASRDPSDVEIYIVNGRNDYTYFESIDISDCVAQVQAWKEANDG